MDEDEEPVEQPESSQSKGKAAHLAPWQFKKGQSGNPLGRHPGKSLKEYAKEYLSSLTDDERLEYFEGMNKESIWKMAEGNPANATDLTTKGEKVIFNVISYGNNDTASVQSEAVPAQTTESTG